ARGAPRARGRGRRRRPPRQSFTLGEGLVGQCAQDRQSVALTDLPPDYLGISSGLGSAAPSSVVAWPLVAQGEALGVVEFASFRPLAAKETALVEELLPIVALSLEILARNVRTRALLAPTQEPAPIAAGAALAEGGAGRPAAGAGRRQAEGRGGDGDEVDVPGQHEPRDPHADERHHRALVSRAEDSAQRQAT